MIGEIYLYVPQNRRQFCFVCPDATEEIQEMEEEFVDDGSLPLDENGALPFYFLDAHEEHSTPDLVYLFGKVANIYFCMKSILPHHQSTVIRDV